MSDIRDDNLMERFDRRGVRRFSARDAIVAVSVMALLLLLLEGPAIRRAGEEMSPGFQRDVVLAVGKPAGWLGDRIPLAKGIDKLTAWLSPDEDLGGGKGGFATTAALTGGIPPVTPDAFDPVVLTGRPAPKHKLRTLLVTGDSLSQPLDVELARRLAGRAKVIRDPHVGTGISKSILLDWGKLSAGQEARHHPDAVVVFIGANEGFPMPGPRGHDVDCCSADWAAIYATRVRRMMDTYRNRGAAHVYWLTLPAPRDAERQKIARVVNAAIRVAAEPWIAQVRVLDTVPIFTPGFRYRDSMPVGGDDQIVRESDGIHLNAAGAKVAAQAVLALLGKDFTG